MLFLMIISLLQNKTCRELSNNGSNQLKLVSRYVIKRTHGGRGEKIARQRIHKIADEIWKKIDGKRYLKRRRLYVFYYNAVVNDPKFVSVLR